MANDQTEITDRDRRMAEWCRTCPACQRAQKKQRGFTFWFVRHVEEGLCPYCKAYEKVYGRKAHEPADAETAPRDN
jgi:hypothetical protein